MIRYIFGIALLSLFSITASKAQFADSSKCEIKVNENRVFLPVLPPVFINNYKFQLSCNESYGWQPAGLGGQHLQPYLIEHPEVLSSMQLFKQNRTTGATLMGIGFASVTVGALVLINYTNKHQDVPAWEFNIPKIAPVGIVGGTIAFFTGNMVYRFGGQQHIRKAIEIHNQEINKKQ